MVGCGVLFSLPSSSFLKTTPKCHGRVELAYQLIDQSHDDIQLLKHRHNDPKTRQDEVYHLHSATPFRFSAKGKTMALQFRLHSEISQTVV